MSQRILATHIKRIVIKLGSSQIVDTQLKPRLSSLQSLANQVHQLRREGIEVVIVSSGAIALGMGALNQAKRPKEIALLQARAAIGQAILMRTWAEVFKRFSIHCGQVLLTWDDFDNRQRFINARHTLEAILDEGAVPIINENDTISTEEIKFGDNDKLSALVASCIGADVLIILSDVEGLYDINKKVYDEVREITPEIEGVAGATKNTQLARGGMKAKIDAVKIVTAAKIACVITSGSTENVLLRVVHGERVGTLFTARQNKILARDHWIAFSAKPKGVLTIDEGAKKALLSGKSLLIPGIKQLKGQFKANDVVAIEDSNALLMARGMVGQDSLTLKNLIESHSKGEVIHRDNLVVLE